MLLLRGLGSGSRVELGADGGGEPAFQMPRAVAALFEFEVAPVVLQRVVDGFGAVGVGGVDYGVGEPPQLLAARIGACSASSCSAVSTASGSSSGRHTGSDRRGGSDPGGGFTGREVQHPDQELGDGGGTVLTG